MRNKTLVLLVLSALGLSACANLKYEEPTSGPTATLIFKTDAIGPVGAILYRQAADCSGAQYAGAVQAGKDVRVRVPADRELATHMTSSSTSAYDTRIRTLCEVVVSFLPAKDNVYQVMYSLYPDQRKCSVLVRGFGVGGNGRGEPVEVNRRIKRTKIIGDDSAHCF